MTFSDVRIAVRGSGAGIITATSHRLRFAGRTGVTVAVGRELTSDPVRMALRAGQDLAISIYARSATGTVTTAGSLNHTNYLSGVGDRTNAAGALSFPQTSQAWYWIDGVDVRPAGPDAGAVVALGDSITAGYNSSHDANRDWVDLLGVRLRATLKRPLLSVLNAGVAGNNLDENTRCFGQSALARMARDVFAQRGGRLRRADRL
jgi:hypothetical protein